MTRVGGKEVEFLPLPDIFGRLDKEQLGKCRVAR